MSFAQISVGYIGWTDKFYDVVVCGAGMAGIATAYSLAIKFQKRVLLIDEGAPLSLTSDKSTECYRNWWGGPDNAMLSLMNRSINLMDCLLYTSPSPRDP